MGSFYIAVYENKKHSLLFKTFTPLCVFYMNLNSNIINQDEK